MSFSVSPEDISDLFCHFGYFLAFFDKFWPFLNLFFISSSDEDINRPNKKVKNTSNKPGPGNNSSSDKSGNRKSAVPKQPHQVPMPLKAPEDVDLGTSFSLTNLLTKVRNGIGILGFWDFGIGKGKSAVPKQPHHVPTPLEAP